MPARADYGARLTPEGAGGVVERVEQGSPASRAGISAGDVLVAVDGSPLRDVIDWQWLTDGADVTVTLRDGDGTRDVLVQRAPGEAWGAAFRDTVFDAVRTCRNRCAFCFMTQLPKGLRRALYLRDDDYRLSFLQGNFVTLTNLSDADVERIAEQHLSPLYVSLHAVDPAVRAQLVCAAEDRALERFNQLLAEGIDLHVQIVLVPGVNDGDVLDETLHWLAEREGVLSVGIVPLGFTAHQARFERSYAESDAARAVIEQVSAWQQAFRERDEASFVYLADEFYLNAQLPAPPAEHYDGYPQYENGIGLVRSFIDEADGLAEQLQDALSRFEPGERVALVTGELFAPVLDGVLGDVDPQARARVLAVPNGFFGGNVSVTGLLTASDLVPAIAADDAAGVYLVPDVVANADGLLLDDVPAAELGMRSGKDVRLVSCDAGGLLGGLRDAAANPPSPKE